MIGHTYDFLFGQEVDAKKEHRRVYSPNGRLVNDPDYTEDYVRGMLGSKMTDAANYHFKAWEYVSKVDIENNAHPEILMVWQGDVLGRTTCSVGWTPDNSALSRIQQYVFVMKSDGRDIDIAKTRSIFGHPNGNPVGDEFRPVGDTIGVFGYRDTYYFDTFLQGPGDFANKRKADHNLFRALGVFKRAGGQTRQVCEYDVSDEPL